MTLKCHTFYLAVSMSDLVLYVGTGDDDLIAHPRLDAILAAFDLKVDIAKLYLEYFDELLVGQGDVYVFQKSPSHPRCFAIDMYRDKYDQLDIISLAFVGDESTAEIARHHLRAFFDAASYPVIYEESGSSRQVDRMLDVRAYPSLIADTGYMQQIKFIYDQ